MKDFREQHPTADSLDDDGCRRLASAVILQAAMDLYDDLDFRFKYPDSPVISLNNVCGVESITKFVRSNWFGCLTDVDPVNFLDTVADWFTKRRSLPRYIGLWRNNNNKNCPEIEYDSGPCYYDSSYLQNIMDNNMYKSNWKWCRRERRFIKRYD